MSISGIYIWYWPGTNLKCISEIKDGRTLTSLRYSTYFIGTGQKMPTNFGPIYLGYRPVQGYLLINYFRDANRK